MRIFFVSFLLLLGGCEFKQVTQPSVLVIAVEGLSFDSISCEPEDEHVYEALRPFCEEAVRFSHAYTPSTLSVATMASLLTGLYPFDHGVHDNARDFLSARFKTASEVALAKGYHTLFVSGGAPIWRKSGLAQGFEIFDDTMDISPGHLYRPAEDVVQNWSSWVEHESARQPFFSVLYLNDLQFPQIATRDAEGEVREKTTDGQIAEVADSLARLTKWLKNHKRWNSTNIVFMGLNGLGRRENENAPPPLNLKSISTQVALFIKPAHRERDNVIQWAVDRAVSLVDVGRTLFDWMGETPAPTSVKELAPISLAESVTKVAPAEKTEANRLILSETDWPDMVSAVKPGARFAVRQNRFLFIDDQHSLIFNTLTDHMETLPLKAGDPLWTTYNADILALIAKMNLKPFAGMRSEPGEEIAVAQEMWAGGSFTRNPSGKERWSKWYLNHALQTKDWALVRRLAEARADSLGVFVARRNLGESVGVPPIACLRLVLNVSGKSNYQAECADDMMLALHTWRASHGEDERLSSQERFVRLYSLHLLDQQIGRHNYLNSLRFDVNPESPRGPGIIDYVLTLKELEPFAKKLSSVMGGKDLAL